MTNLRRRFDEWLASLSERDRRAVNVGALLSLIILITATVLTVVLESTSAVERVATKRLLLAELPTLRDREQRLRRLGGDVNLPLERLVKRILSQHDIDATVEVQSNSSIRLRATAASFDSVIDTLGDLEAVSISVRRSALTATTAGRVDVDMELQKSGS